MKPSKPIGMERRRFLSATGSAVAIAVASSPLRTTLASASHPVAASDRLRVGAIGVGGRGSL
ncbi:MAG: twin-arginine translocation signal domain-containing protein, partial [Planctomycetota bacterium]